MTRAAWGGPGLPQRQESRDTLADSLSYSLCAENSRCMYTAVRGIIGTQCNSLAQHNHGGQHSMVSGSQGKNEIVYADYVTSQGGCHGRLTELMPAQNPAGGEVFRIWCSRSGVGGRLDRCSTGTLYVESCDAGAA